MASQAPTPMARWRRPALGVGAVAGGGVSGAALMVGGGWPLGVGLGTLSAAWLGSLALGLPGFGKDWIWGRTGCMVLSVSPFAAAAAKPVLCVVVSFCDARSAGTLVALLHQLLEPVSGLPGRRWPFSLQVVVVDAVRAGSPLLSLPEALVRHVTVVRQHNPGGHDMDAWEQGWRHHGDARHYVFLTSECRVLRTDALLRYWQLLERWPRGVWVGEYLQRWSGWTGYRKAFPERSLAVDHLASRLHIALGASASHLRLAVIGVSAASLRRTGGWPSDADPLAAEVLVTRRALAHGMRVVQAGWRPFEYFGHMLCDEQLPRSSWWRSWLSRLGWSLLPM